MTPNHCIGTVLAPCFTYTGIPFQLLMHDSAERGKELRSPFIQSRCILHHPIDTSYSLTLPPPRLPQRCHSENTRRRKNSLRRTPSPLNVICNLGLSAACAESDGYERVMAPRRLSR